MYSTPVLPSLAGALSNQPGLPRTSSGAANQFSDLEEKSMLFQIAYPDFSIVPLIPASVQIQSTLSEEQKKKVQKYLSELQKIFNDYPPIRDSFTAMEFMLQNPHLMEIFLNASPSHNNGLPLTKSKASVRMEVVQILQLFEAFVRSFNLPTILQSMGEVPPTIITQGLAQLDKLYQILGQNPAFASFLQGLTFGLQLQQSNPPQAKKASNPIRDVAGMFLAAKGGIIKKLGNTADVVFENVKNVNDMVQRYTTFLKDIPGVSNAVEPAQKFVNTILDGMHMVIGDTAESVGDALQSQKSQQPPGRGLFSVTNTKNLGLDKMMEL